MPARHPRGRDNPSWLIASVWPAIANWQRQRVLMEPIFLQLKEIAPNEDLDEAPSWTGIFRNLLSCTKKFCRIQQKIGTLFSGCRLHLIYGVTRPWSALD